MADKKYKKRIGTIKIPIQIQQKADKITIPGMNINFQGKLGWIESLVEKLPLKIIIKNNKEVK